MEEFRGSTLFTLVLFIGSVCSKCTDEVVLDARCHSGESNIMSMCDVLNVDMKVTCVLLTHEGPLSNEGKYID